MEALSPIIPHPVPSKTSSSRLTYGVTDISAKLSISEERALFFIGKMAREGKITLGEIRIGK